MHFFGVSPRSRNMDVPYLRDIYPVNVLSRIHLEKIYVGANTLSEWISMSPERGHLNHVSNETWIWELERSEIPKVQKVFAEFGLLIAH